MIPRELRDVPQWLVSGAEKIPISPKTGIYADVRQHDLYVSYSEATAYASQLGYDVGFVLTRDDPFTVIDLDNPETNDQRTRHTAIYHALPTYAELSRSGLGVHIWCLGHIPRGVRRDKVELYFQDRYMICTGHALNNLPIVDCQSWLDALFNEMDQGGYQETELEERPESLEDNDLVQMASHAANGELFNQLCIGEWQKDYPSQSEADFALMNILAFYTQSNDQVKRLFRYSKLGQRQKAQREEYLDRMLRKIRAEEIPIVDLSKLPSPSVNGSYDTRTIQGPNATTGFYNLLPDGESLSATGTDFRVKQETYVHGTIPVEEISIVNNAVTSDFTLPPGFLGEIASYIHDTSTRPVREVATASAIAMCAGIFGRQFNISGTGLNQYIIMLAKTGIGKEDGPRGIERLFSAMRKSVPVVDQFFGPGSFASGQGMVRTLDKQPCFFSVLGEFGLTLQDLSDQGANQLTRNMRRVYLDVYSKSGKNSVLPQSAYSDSQKNTKNLYAPAMTLLGESTPETFFEGLSLHHVESGLIPRFLIIEYTGERTARNPNAFAPPSEGLVRRLTDTVEIPCRMQANHSFEDVTLDAEARRELDAFDHMCDVAIKESGHEAIRQLWNRAHLKALRLTALMAVVDRPHSPVANVFEARWSVELVIKDIEHLTERFSKGDIGEGNSKQLADLERIVSDYLESNGETIKHTYIVNPKMHEMHCIPHVYFQRRALPLSSFRKDRRGSVAALDTALGLLCDQGRLVRLHPKQVHDLFNSTARVYRVM